MGGVTWLQLLWLSLVVLLSAGMIVAAIKQLAETWQTLIEQSKKQSAILELLQRAAQLQRQQHEETRH